MRQVAGAGWLRAGASAGAVRCRCWVPSAGAGAGAWRRVPALVL